MALTISEGDVAVVEVVEQWTAPTDEAVTAGQVVRLNTQTGRATLANATTAAEANAWGIALTSANQSGITITALKRGVIDLGNALGSIDYGGTVYLDNTDGAMGSAAGSVSKVIGRVVPAWGGGTVGDKLLHVDIS